MSADRNARHSDRTVSISCGWSRIRTLSRSARSIVASSWSRSSARSASRSSRAIRAWWVGVVADLRDPLEGLLVHPRDDEVVDLVRRPPRRALREDPRERLGVLGEPPVELAQRQVHQPVVRLVAHDLAEQAARDRADRLLAQPRDDRLLDDLGDRLVAHPLQPQGGDVRGLVDDPPGVGRLEQPVGQPVADLGRQDPVADDVLAQEVLAHEVLQALGQHVLAARDQRGMRDRDSQRVPEQRRHREPVGHGADHRRLGSGVHEPPEALVLDPQRREEHDRGEHQQGQRHEPHLAQPAAALSVEDRVGRQRQGERRLGHVPSFHHLRDRAMTLTREENGGRGALGSGSWCLPPEFGAVQSTTRVPDPRTQPEHEGDLAVTGRAVGCRT